MLGAYFGILYYVVFPAVIYLISVAFNTISQMGACNGVTNVSACFSGAAYTVSYLYVAMCAVNLIGPNGIWTLEPQTAAPIVNIPSKSSTGASAPSANNISTLKSNTPTPNIIGATAPNAENLIKSPSTINPKRTPVNEDPTQSGGGRQTGGGGMSDGALMIRSFFTTLRAPAMSLFIRDPNAATLEDVETKSPIYTGIGVGFWAFLATISGQIISSSIAQKC